MTELVHIAPHFILSGFAFLLLIGVLSSRISSYFNVPILLMFLLVGMVSGSDGLGIPFDNFNLANWVGVIAIIFILYSGGLGTSYREVRQVLIPGGILVSLGVFITAFAVAAGAHWILHWDFIWCLLLGSIVSSTDAAAVFAILRGRSVSLKGNLKPLLEFESGANDPMAALMTIFMIDLINSNVTAFSWEEGLYFLVIFVLRMAVGIAGGYFTGLGGVWLFNKIKLDYEGLFFVMGIAVTLFAYGASEILYGNGFMAVYVCGMVMGNRRYKFKKGLGRFNEGIGWLMQVALFTSLGLLVSPSNFIGMMSHPVEKAAVPGAQTIIYESVTKIFTADTPWSTIFAGLADTVAFRAFLVTLVLIFIARPVAVFLGLTGSRYNLKEKLFTSWVGLRGAAPIVLATFPLVMIHGDSRTGLIFDIIFFVVILSVLIQGLTLMPVARLLHLDSPLEEKERIPLELEETGTINGDMHEFELRAGSVWIDKTLAEMQLPTGVLVMLIRRNNRFILARGNTKLLLGDGMLLMGDRETLLAVGKQYFPEAKHFID